MVLIVSKVKEGLKHLLPLFTDTNSKGEKKVSIGRAPLLVVLITMCVIYVRDGVGPDQGILAYMALAMAYNGFSKKVQNNESTATSFSPEEDGEGD
jgi:hypothetical protein